MLSESVAYAEFAHLAKKQRLSARATGQAILQDDVVIRFRVLDPNNRPVSAVADQFEVRDVVTVDVCLSKGPTLTLLFDPEHALDERITLEQFAH